LHSKANFETGFSHSGFEGWVTMRFQAMGFKWIHLYSPTSM
jgi:hypothetical protein